MRYIDGKFVPVNNDTGNPDGDDPDKEDPEPSE
jgi:hypothetical protein